MLLDNPYAPDVRVEREAMSLIRSGYHVQLIALKSGSLPETEVVGNVAINRLLNHEALTFKGLLTYKKLAKQIAERFEFDFIHCHDYKMLILGWSIKKLNPEKFLVYDSHELLLGSPIHYLDKKITTHLKSKIVRHFEIILEKKASRDVDGFITVGENIRQILKSHFHTAASTPFIVLRNLPVKKSLISSERILSIREKLGFNSRDVLVVFIGKNFFPGKQNLESVLAEMATPSAKVHLVLIGGSVYKDHVKKLASRLNSQNVHMIGDISSELTHEYLSAMDIGLLPIWNKKDLSYWNALPNKLFEYFRAGIPVVTTAQPEYKRVIDDSATGICVDPDSGESFLSAIERIITKYQFYKEKALKARTIYCWENEEIKLSEFYKKLPLQLN